MVEDPLQLLRIKCVADEQGDGVLGELLFSETLTFQDPLEIDILPRRGKAENISC